VVRTAHLAEAMVVSAAEAMQALVAVTAGSADTPDFPATFRQAR